MKDVLRKELLRLSEVAELCSVSRNTIYRFFSGGDEAGGERSFSLPRDAFDANGFQGQYIHIIPSKQLVVVRLGATSYRGHDHERLPREVIGAMRRD
jgi:CubicO group peptidase (beta-lactamase class C family)